jgi:hypothetical protein
LQVAHFPLNLVPNRVIVSWADSGYKSADTHQQPAHSTANGHLGMVSRTTSTADVAIAIDDYIDDEYYRCVV